jgi:hypothetical protein
MIHALRRIGVSRSVLILALAAGMAPVLVQAQAPTQPRQRPGPDVKYLPLTAQDVLSGIMDGGLAPWIEDPARRTMFSTTIASSYIFGVADSANGTQWCAPAGLNAQDLMKPVLDTLNDLPKERQSERASKVVIEALGKAYPCQR